MFGSRPHSLRDELLGSKAPQVKGSEVPSAPSKPVRFIFDSRYVCVVARTGVWRFGDHQIFSEIALCFVAEDFCRWLSGQGCCRPSGCARWKQR